MHWLVYGDDAGIHFEPYRGEWIDRQITYALDRNSIPWEIWAVEIDSMQYEPDVLTKTTKWPKGRLDGLLIKEIKDAVATHKTQIAAARFLGLNQRTLGYQMARLGIQAPWSKGGTYGFPGLKDKSNGKID